MKHVLYLFCFVLCVRMLLGQTRQTSRESLLEVQFSLSKINYERLLSNSKSISGLGVVFTKQIARHLDWRSSLTASYTDIVSQSQSTKTQKDLLLQGDIAIRAPMFNTESVIRPYVLTGVGVVSYRSKYQSYTPVGAGVVVSLFSDLYLVNSFQYRIPLSKTLNRQSFWSLGIAGTIGKRKVSLPNIRKEVAPSLPSVIIRDSDNDGIVDTADACPTTAGLAKFQGCPDSDNDGIPDKDDQCPNTPGVAKYFGCPIPDRDHDSVNDEEDKCPDVPGVEENAGCPVMAKQLVEKANLTAQNIFFKTGSTQLLPQSYLSLDDFVQLLSQNPNIKVWIEGHTDNSGLPEANEILSLGRAQSVMQYLKKSGVSEDRMSATGFGQRRPIADNSTISGRAKNRRVELILSY